MDKELSLFPPFCRAVILPTLAINARFVAKVCFVFGLSVERWSASQDLALGLWW